MLTAPAKHAAWPDSAELRRLSPIEVLTMKDVLFLVVTTAFFAMAFLYAKSFDHL